MRTTAKMREDASELRGRSEALADSDTAASSFRGALLGLEATILEATADYIDHQAKALKDAQDRARQDIETAMAMGIAGR
jgi:hypothetical protein